MKAIVVSASTAMILSLLALPASPQGQGLPPTFVAAVKLLESDPFNKDADRLRVMLSLSLMPVPQVSANVCAAPFGPLAKKNKYKYTGDVLAQSMFAAGAFLAEQPDLAKDSLNVRVAGVEGALRMYAAMVRVQPKAQHEFLDGLLEKQQKGELRSYVAEVWQRECNTQKK
jgi:hypothetical protein